MQGHVDPLAIDMLPCQCISYYLSPLSTALLSQNFHIQDTAQVWASPRCQI